ncbi:MAG: hypothetical protein IJN00_00640, partial [Clostridia bacterium]|nr:hypothetical protein [Clostridia bacterium]
MWLNGKLIEKQTGDARPEYELHFEPPNKGDEAEYTVKVRAWDGRGNSAMKVYTLHYRTVSEGDALGNVNIVVDATTVGLGIIDSATFPIVQGDTAKSVLDRFFEEYGYEASYNGPYLARLSRGDICSGAAIPERLRQLIERDGFPFSNSSDRDSLGEYDFTMASGWMYSIDGSVYEGRDLDSYTLSKNTTIYLRFTLAYGKDIGGGGSGKGKLSGYCGTWTGGGYHEKPHGTFTVIERIEPTAEAPGLIRSACSVCGEPKE